MLLDIFIPFWGDPSLLYETVDSVLGQSNDSWRLTVIDDDYPDAAVGDYFRRLSHPRVTYVRNSANMGITANFRQSAQRATAEYVTILGCDDRLRPNYVDAALHTIRQVPAADVIQLGVQTIDEHGDPSSALVDRVKRRLLTPRSRGTVITLRGERMATSLIRGNWLYWPSLVFRTATIKRVDFRDEFPVIQDLALLMDIAFAGGTLAYLPTEAFDYRRHDSSASQRALLDGSRFAGERAYYRLACSLAAAHGWRTTERAAKWRVMSRLHAITELPRIAAKGSGNGLRSALAHALAF